MKLLLLKRPSIFPHHMFFYLPRSMHKAILLYFFIKTAYRYSIAE